jgi:hypothetical protein
MYSVDDITWVDKILISVCSRLYSWAMVLKSCIVEGEDGKLSLVLNELESQHFCKAAEEELGVFPGSGKKLGHKLHTLWSSIEGR